MMLLKTVTRITVCLSMVCLTLFNAQAWGKAPTDAETQSAFAKAIDDAAVAELSELNSNLIAITPENNELVWNAGKSKVLLVTWKKQRDLDFSDVM